MKDRDEYWDSLKFILIFLVVYAHIIESYAPDGSFNRAIYNLIYTFHMPLFIFVSGRFSQIRDRDKYKKGIIRIFETFIVFHVIWQLIMLSGKGFSTISVINFFIFPSWTLWYLLSIVWWRIIIYIIPLKVLKERPLMILSATLLISVLGGGIPVESHFSLQRTMAFMPFFFMGFYSTRIDVKAYLNKIPFYLPIFILIAGFVLYYYCLNENVNIVLTCRRSYWTKPGVSPIFLCLARCLLIISAIVISVMIMRIVPQKHQIAKWGSCTLFIYMYHTFFVRSFYFGVNSGIIPNLILNNELLLIIIAVALTLALAYSSRYKLPNIIINPVSYLKHKK